MTANGMFRLTLFLALLSTMECGELYRDFMKRVYEEQRFGVDNSAATVCYVAEGQLEEVKSGDPKFGYTCNAVLKAHSADQKVAEEMCKSVFPHYILEAEVVGDKTRCKFAINLRCSDDYFLIYEKCYKMFEIELPFGEAKSYCATKQGNKPAPQLAEYTSDVLGMDLKHMDFPEAWVQVPDLEERFSNANKEGGALYVLKNAWKYERKEGVIEMMDLKSKHYPLCEYTPPVTIGHSMWIISKFSKDLVYPIKMDGESFSVDFSQVPPIRDQAEADRAVASIIGIFGGGVVPKINIVTYPNGKTIYTPIFHPPGWVPEGCPDGWLPYARQTGQNFCHILIQFDGEAHDTQCQELRAHFSGFDSKEEITAVLKHFGYTNGILAIGGRVPCEHVSCNDKPKRPRKGVEKFNFGWHHGVASNLDLLYDHMTDSDLTPRDDDNVVDLITSSPESWYLWTHNWHGLDAIICGRFA